MKRNKELMITMLHQIKKDAEYAKQRYQSDEEFMYHLYLLKDGGYVDADWYTLYGEGQEFHTINEIKITHKGHELIELYSNRVVIQDVKEYLKERESSIDDVPFDIMNQVAKKIIKSRI